MLGKKELSRAKLTSTPGSTVPPGAQNITIVFGPPSGSTTGYSVVRGDGPFQIWFRYEGGPATVFDYMIDNGPLQAMQEGTYSDLSAQESIFFQWQVDPEQAIKFGWIFLSGC